MKFVKLFEDFINEERHDVWHKTQYTTLSNILLSDELKTSRPAFKYKDNEKSISVTRDKAYSQDKSQNEEVKDFRILLDNDKLYRHGYKSYPVDELSIKHSNLPLNDPFFNPMRYTTAKLKDYKASEPSKWVEPEREERFFKHIKNLGKFIKAIETTEIEWFKSYKDLLETYLQKYPHIELRLITSRFKPKYYTALNLEDF